MRYIVKGFTGPHPDFTDTIELPDNIDFETCLGGDRRASTYQNLIKPALLNSYCGTDYLNVFDDCGGECRSDLADSPGQIVLIAESMGCEVCNKTADGNELTDECDFDAPHGGYMLTFTPLD